MGKRVRRSAAAENVHQLFPEEASEGVRAGGYDPLDADRPRRGRGTAPAGRPPRGAAKGPRATGYVKNVTPKSQAQESLVRAIGESNMVFAIGPAGTGKTYLSIAQAVEALDAGKVDRIVLSRPAVEAGERIGYLPGDMHEKLAPFLRPLYDALSDRMGGKRLRQLVQEGTIEIAPLGFMRGRTINNAFIVLDEMQNASFAQLKMAMTRLGWGSTMVITGDPDQSDLAPGESGLAAMAAAVDGRVEGLAVCRLGAADVVRHPLVARLLGVI